MHLLSAYRCAGEDGGCSHVSLPQRLRFVRKRDPRGAGTATTGGAYGREGRRILDFVFLHDCSMLGPCITAPPDYRIYWPDERNRFPPAHPFHRPHYLSPGFAFGVMGTPSYTAQLIQNVSWSCVLIGLRCITGAGPTNSCTDMENGRYFTTFDAHLLCLRRNIHEHARSRDFCRRDTLVGHCRDYPDIQHAAGRESVS